MQMVPADIILTTYYIATSTILGTLPYVTDIITPRYLINTILHQYRRPTSCHAPTLQSIIPTARFERYFSSKSLITETNSPQADSQS